MRKLPVLLSLAAATLGVPVATQAAEADWFYFPMYARDTAHAVHLSALKIRPDGLLESASRYPRHPDENWSEADSAKGWYNYERRLIDCSSGAFISFEEQLLARDGSVIARRDISDEMLSNWKSKVANGNAVGKWPSNSEIFMACAAAGSPEFLKQRRQVAQKKPPALTYRPIVQDLIAESSEISRRQTFRKDVAQLAKPMPSSLKELFDRSRQPYRRWLASFVAMPETMRQVPTVKMPVQAEPITMRIGFGSVSFRLLGSNGDGVVRYQNIVPMAYDIPEEYLKPPKAAQQAREVSAEMWVDCLGGEELAVNLSWIGPQGQTLVTTPFAPKVLVAHLQERDQGNVEIDLNDRQQEGRAASVCRAAAAVCTGEALDVEDQESRSAVIPEGDSPAAALIAWRNQRAKERARQLPACRFGSYSF